MAKRNALKQEYFKETGKHWKQQYQYIPTIEYTNWLEDRLVKNNVSLDCVSTRVCRYCDNTAFLTKPTQYNDADGDYDNCEIVYCANCKQTHSINI